MMSLNIQFLSIGRTYRRAIELQARLLGRYLQEDLVYKPLVLR